jgi:hypothetical protein
MVQRLVAMAVAVRTLGHWLMLVVVMPIVMPMRVFVLQRLVFVFVAVRLGQVQQHAGEHQPAAQRHPAAGRAVAQQQRQRRADEGCSEPSQGVPRRGVARAEASSTRNRWRRWRTGRALPQRRRSPKQRQQRCGSAPSALTITTWLGRVRPAARRVLSLPGGRRHRHASGPQLRAAARLVEHSTMPPASSRAIAAQPRPSMVSRYRRQASTAVNKASSVSISEALVPLVCCSPQASATGPITAPKPIASNRGRSAR